MADIRGFLPISLIEFPGRISSVVFTGGCNLRCPFCHNRDLIIGLDGMDKISEEDLLNKIEKKKEWIDAVCFTGGEPALNADLPFLFKKIKQIRGISLEPLEIMLETNGTNSEMIYGLTEKNIVDYIAMDIKAPFEDYNKLGASENVLSKIKESAEILLGKTNKTNTTYKIGVEFRITAAPEIVTLDNIQKIGEQIKGAKKAALQQFRPNITLDKNWQKKQPHSEDVLKEMAEILREFAEEVVV